MYVHYMHVCVYLLIFDFRLDLNVIFKVAVHNWMAARNAIIRSHPRNGRFKKAEDGSACRVWRKAPTYEDRQESE